MLRGISDSVTYTINFGGCPKRTFAKNAKIMKKILATLVAASALILCGCGANVNENKTPEQAKTEAASMDAASLQKQVDALKAFIAEKNAEAKALAEKLSKIPLAEQMGNDAKALREEAAKIAESVKKIQAQLGVYVEELKAKATAAAQSK